MSQIETADTYHAARIAQLGMQGRAAELALAHPSIGGLWENTRVLPPAHPPVGISNAGAIRAYVNHGRWIVQCACGEAQMASRLDPRHYCSNCRNTAVQGQWRAVIFPPDADAIEAVLSRRDYPMNRNWLPTETLADLVAENAEHGVR